MNVAELSDVVFLVPIDTAEAKELKRTMEFCKHVSIESDIMTVAAIYWIIHLDN